MVGGRNPFPNPDPRPLGATRGELAKKWGSAAYEGADPAP